MTLAFFTLVLEAIRRNSSGDFSGDLQEVKDFINKQSLSSTNSSASTKKRMSILSKGLKLKPLSKMTVGSMEMNYTWGGCRHVRWTHCVGVASGEVKGSQSVCQP